MEGLRRYYSDRCGSALEEKCAWRQRCSDIDGLRFVTKVAKVTEREARSAFFSGSASGGDGHCFFADTNVNRATAILHAVADRPLVNIQPDVIHSLHGGASLVSLNQLGR
jgi:hypothetical protein